MPTAIVVNAGTFTYVDQKSAAKNLGANPASGRLSAHTTSGTYDRFPLLWIKSPVPAGGTLASATLTLYAKGSSSGSRTVSVTQISADWKASNVTYTTLPATTGAAATASVGALADGAPIVVDVTTIVQSWASGAVNYGLKVSQNTATAFSVYGFSSKFPPKLTVTWSDAPDKPTQLVPSGGVVGVAKWMCQWSYSDLDGDALAAVQVQVDPAANWATPGFDSGAVASTVPQLDLATTTYAGLSSGSSTYWRTRVQDDTGAWSAWSDPAQVTYTPKGTLTLTAPSTGSPYVHESVPPITWTFSLTQSAYRVQVLDAKNAILTDSGWITGTATTWIVPEGILNDTDTFSAVVMVKDSLDRVLSPGDPAWVTASRAFTYQAVGSVTAPTSVTATEVVDLPAADVVWTIATAPDYFTVLRDGVVLLAALDPADCLISSGTYGWVDAGAQVGVEHTYAVRAVVNHQSSNLTSSDPLLLYRSGIYLLTPDLGYWFVITGQSTDGWVMSDNVTIYQPLGSSQRMQVVQGQYGLAGHAQGLLIQRPGQSKTVLELEADLNAMKETPEQTFRLAFGDMNIPVKVSNLSVGPSPDSSTGNIRRVAQFDFFQCGEFPFKTRL